MWNPRDHPYPGLPERAGKGRRSGHGDVDDGTTVPSAGLDACFLGRSAAGVVVTQGQHLDLGLLGIAGLNLETRTMSLTDPGVSKLLIMGAPFSSGRSR